jgi:hypothetical protein
MKVSCEVIQDLLALYHDGVCSKDSRAMVEEHLQDCEVCKKMLADMEEDIMKERAEEVKPLVAIQINWNRMRREAFLKGAVIAMCVFLVISAGYGILTKWECIPMDKNELMLTEVYQTSDGMIHIDYNDLYDLNYYKTALIVGDDGYGYVENYRSVLAEREENSAQYLFAERGFNFTEELKCYDEDGNLVPVERIYLGVANHPEDSILVWEKGMEVRPATQEEEERYSHMGK